MKKYLLLAVFIFISANSMAQTSDLKEIISDISNIKSRLAQLEQEISEVKAENKYLKESINVGKPILTGSSESIDFTIISINGSRTEQTITVTLLLNNNVAKKRVQLSMSQATDLQGNIYKGNYDFSEELSTNVPTKAIISFKGVIENVKILKLLSVSYYNLQSRPTALEFRDLQIEWK